MPVDLPLDQPGKKIPYDALDTGRVDLLLDLPNMSSRMFRCAHHRGIFAWRRTNILLF